MITSTPHCHTKKRLIKAVGAHTLCSCGYMQDGELYFYIKDYQGNVRVVLNQANQPVEVNSYYPYGGLMAATTTEGSQPYKYSTKELDRENGLDWYDFHARQMDPMVPRFTTIDPKCEKYYAISPYAYCAGNPIAYIDPNGEKIYVSNEYVDLFLEDLQAVFGEYTSGFSFNDGYLQYTGSNKGMTKEQKELLKGITKLIQSNDVTSISYVDKKEVIDKDRNYSLLATDNHGGEATALIADNPKLWCNYIIVTPTPPKYFSVYEVLDNYYENYYGNTLHYNGKPNYNKDVIVRTNRADLLWHGIGHVVKAGKPQNQVLEFNNFARKLLGLPKRNPDKEHNKKI